MPVLEYGFAEILVWGNFIGIDSIVDFSPECLAVVANLKCGWIIPYTPKPMVYFALLDDAVALAALVRLSGLGVGM